MVGPCILQHVDAVWDDGCPRDISRVEISDEALCATGGASVTSRRSTCWSSATSNAPTGWPGRFSATPRKRATCPRRPSFGSTRRRAAFAARSRFSTWFYRILVNLCLDARRRRRWWQLDRGPVEREDGIPANRSWSGNPLPPIDPVDELARGRVMTQLWKAVDTLSPQQRAALLLQVQEELPTSEIAAVLKCSEATVRVHLHRALHGAQEDDEEGLICGIPRPS